MTSFKADEAYVPPSNITRRYSTPIFLTVGSYREMLSNKRMRLAFAVSVLSLILVNAAIIALGEIHHHVLGLSLVTILAFIWVQKQFITISRGLNFRQSYDEFFKEKMPDGWYEDPWAFGEAGKQRYFADGVWSDEVKFVDGLFSEEKYQ